MTGDDPWVKVEAIKGGQLVRCRLCGKRFKRSFYADNTNYAEALRLATAYAATHRLSPAHKAATQAFHADSVPPASKEDLTLAAIFHMPLPNERDLRRRAAQAAAERAARKEPTP